MDALPYYKWLWIDYRANRKVQRMPWQARGLYRELLDEFWSEGSLPDDTERLAEVCGCTREEFEMYWQHIRPCFAEQNGVLINAKMDEQRTAVDAARTAKARAGAVGGKVSNSRTRAENPQASAKQMQADAKQVLADPKDMQAQPDIAEQSRAEQEQSRVGSPPKENIASLVSKIAVAFPKSRLVALTEADVRPEQRVSIIQAVDAEVERVGVTRTQAAQMILERLDLLASAVPSSEWKFFQKLPEFMRDRQYRLDPEVFTSGSNQQNQAGRVSPAEQRRNITLDSSRAAFGRRYGGRDPAPVDGDGGSVPESDAATSNAGYVAGEVGNDDPPIRGPAVSGCVIEGR